ncbi:unnamed protein product [Merluccius merluccius]
MYFYFLFSLAYTQHAPPPPLQNGTMSTNCTDDLTLLRRYYLSTTYSLIFAVGLVGNLTAIGIYVTMLRPWKSSSIIMVNLALADLLYVLTLPFLVHYYARGEAWHLGCMFCRLVRVAFHLNLYSSLLFLPCLAAFRWLVVTQPLRAAQVQRCRWGVAACTVVWVAAITEVAPMLYIISTTKGEGGAINRTVCVDFASSAKPECVWQYGWLLTVLGFLLPLVVVATCNAGIARELAKGPYKASPCRVRARRLAFTILAVFVVCFLPYHVLRLLRVDTLRAPERWSCTARQGIHAAYIVSRPLAGANTLYNLALYTLAGDRFHQALQRVLSGCRQRFRCLLTLVYTAKITTSRTKVINPEDGKKCSARQRVSKKTRRVVQRKVMAINPHVNSFIRSLMEFEWRTSN